MAVNGQLHTDGEIYELIETKANKNNPEFTGTLTLGKGTEDEVTITASQLKQLLELLN